MTVCNMSIEAGARAGMIAPDDTTFAYLEGRPYAPSGADRERAIDHWRGLVTDPDAVFDREVRIDGAQLRPYVTVKEFLQGPVKDDKQFLHGWVFQVVWQNTGATPTRGFRYWAALRQFDQEIPADFD